MIHDKHNRSGYLEYPPARESWGDLVSILICRGAEVGEWWRPRERGGGTVSSSCGRNYMHGVQRGPGDSFIIVIVEASGQITIVRYEEGKSPT